MKRLTTKLVALAALVALSTTTCLAQTLNHSYQNNGGVFTSQPALRNIEINRDYITVNIVNGNSTKIAAIINCKSSNNEIAKVGAKALHTTFSNPHDRGDVAVRFELDEKELLKIPEYAKAKTRGRISALVRWEVTVNITSPKSTSYRLNSDYSTIKFEDINSLDLRADYSNIKGGAVDGISNISADYSDITIGQLGSTSNISTDYSKLIFGDINGITEISADYSEIGIKNVGRFAKIEADYSDIKINGRAESLSIENDYSDIKINDVTNLEIEADYTDIEFGVLTRMGEIEIEGDYSDVICRVRPSMNFYFDFEVEYGEIKYYGVKGNFDNSSTRSGSISIEQSGTIGSGRPSGGQSLDIEISYGDINLTTK